MKKLLYILPVAALVIFWTGCKKSESSVTPPSPDNEFITTVRVKATNTTDATDTLTAQWVQKDATGATAPDTTKAQITLKKNATYYVEISFLDETKNPAEDITTEVQERSNYHLVCFDVTNGLMAVNRLDKDSNTPQLPLGLKDNFITSATTGNGYVTVTLHHQPDGKTGECNLGSTDAEAKFRLTVQ